MKFIYYLIILSFCCLHISSCQSSITHNFNEVEEMLDTQPDSALLLLYELEKKYPQMNDENKALFGLLHFNVSYGKNINYDAEYINYSLQYFKNNNKNNKLAYCYYSTSRIHIDDRQYKESINMLLQTIEVCDKNDFELLGKTYNKLGLVSSYQFETEHSLKYYNQAIVYFEKTDNTDAIAQVCSNIGLMYMYSDDYAKAMEYYRKALTTTKDSTIMGDALKDIGFIYSIEEKYDSALYYLYQSAEYPYYSTNRTTQFYTIADVYYEMGQYDSAMVYCNKVLEGYSDIYVDRGCLEILIKIKTQQNNSDAALLYMNQLKEVQDSIQTIETQSNIKDVETIHNLEKTNEKWQTRHIYLLVSIVILIILLAYIIYRFTQKSKKQKEYTDGFKNTLEETQKENEQVKEELQQKQESLIEKLNEELQLTKAKYKDEWKDSNFEQRESITKRIYQEVFLYDYSDKFITKMDKLLNNVPSKLAETYPNTTQKDILWCCLYLLNVPSNDMCIVMDYKPTSLYKFKQRLYKKWGFDNVKDFEIMLQKLIFES